MFLIDYLQFAVLSSIIQREQMFNSFILRVDNDDGFASSCGSVEVCTKAKNKKENQ